MRGSKARRIRREHAVEHVRLARLVKRTIAPGRPLPTWTKMRMLTIGAAKGIKQADHRRRYARRLLRERRRLEHNKHNKHNKREKT